MQHLNKSILFDFNVDIFLTSFRHDKVKPHFHDRNNRCFFHVLVSRIFGDCTYVHIFMQCINVCHNVNKTVVSIGQDTK